MSLQKRVDEDLKDAMRAKDAARLSVLRLLKAALKNATIEKVGADGELNDADAITVIRKQVKQRQQCERKPQSNPGEETENQTQSDQEQREFDAAIQPRAACAGA